MDFIKFGALRKTRGSFPRAPAVLPTDTQTGTGAAAAIASLGRPGASEKRLVSRCVHLPGETSGTPGPVRFPSCTCTRTDSWQSIWCSSVQAQLKLRCRLITRLALRVHSLPLIDHRKKIHAYVLRRSGARSQHGATTHGGGEEHGGPLKPATENVAVYVFNMCCQP